MGSTVILRRLEVIKFLSTALSEHKELINTSLNAYPSFFFFHLFPLMLHDNLCPFLIYTPTISPMAFRGAMLEHCCVCTKLMAWNNDGKQCSHC